MKKTIFALLVFTVCVISVNAQENAVRTSKPLHLSFGIDGGAPLGDNANVSAFVIGGDLQAAYHVSSNFSLTASAGVDARLNKGGLVNTIYFAPLLGGLRFYFSDKLFISEQAGYSLGMTKGLDGVFTNVAGLGFKLSPSSDILVGYKSLFNTGAAKNFNTLAVRLAYVFGK